MLINFLFTAETPWIEAEGLHFNHINDFNSTVIQRENYKCCVAVQKHMDLTVWCGPVAVNPINLWCGCSEFNCRRQPLVELVKKRLWSKWLLFCANMKNRIPFTSGIFEHQVKPFWAFCEQLWNVMQKAQNIFIWRTSWCTHLAARSSCVCNPSFLTEVGV